MKKTNIPTFDQLPAMVADLTSKLDELLKRPSISEPDDSVDIMGSNKCAAFLSELEGKPISIFAVYNRMHRGKLPYQKNGAKLYFSRSAILTYLADSQKYRPRISIVDAAKSY